MPTFKLISQESPTTPKHEVEKKIDEEESDLNRNHEVEQKEGQKETDEVEMAKREPKLSKFGKSSFLERVVNMDNALTSEEKKIWEYILEYAYVDELVLVHSNMLLTCILSFLTNATILYMQKRNQHKDH
ncbi:hypothetical protein HanIR_Chr02g0065161 [Helianthus annuus]|nr:hypothetical protein HanIR_Chr02g0065161 [Helianthus annuus]